ncbi:MAG: hypothetical protein HY748_01365 [Elusimicrobia bacterium]|nr:hypothetical protein [Elusimicrobiota bacterium]
MVPARFLLRAFVMAGLLAPGVLASAPAALGQTDLDRVQRLAVNWVPAKPYHYWAFSRPTLFITYPAVEKSLPVDEVVAEIADRGVLAGRLISSLRGDPQEGKKLPAVILDCQGPWSVGLAVELFKNKDTRFQMVPMFNSTTGLDGALDPGAARTLAALVGLRSEAGKTGDKESPPVFILDRSRLDPKARLKNDLILPAAAYFRGKGISSVVYVHDSAAEGEAAWASDIADRLKRLRPTIQVKTVRLNPPK